MDGSTHYIDPDKPDPDEPTGHAETLIEMIRKMNELEERIRILENRNWQI